MNYQAVINWMHSVNRAFEDRHPELADEIDQALIDGRRFLDRLIVHARPHAVNLAQSFVHTPNLTQVTKAAVTAARLTLRDASRDAAFMRSAERLADAFERSRGAVLAEVVARLPLLVPALQAPADAGPVHHIES